jgi:hypothetical protein
MTKVKTGDKERRRQISDFWKGNYYERPYDEI